MMSKNEKGGEQNSKVYILNVLVIRVLESRSKEQENNQESTFNITLRVMRVM